MTKPILFAALYGLTLVAATALAQTILPQPDQPFTVEHASASR